MLSHFTSSFAVEPGHRLTLAHPPGSADSFLLAQLLQSTTTAGKLNVVVCAKTHDATRLLEEIKLFAPELRVHYLPDWETLPYDSLSAHQDLVSERLATLYQLQQGDLDVLLVAASTAIQRLAPPAFLASTTFFFKTGEKINEAKLREQLTTAGYSHVSQVMSPGEYSVRGGIIDLFPTGTVLPFRLDLFDNEIESIKTFDVDSQRSLYPVREMRLLPGREYPLDEQARARFRSAWRERFEGDPSRVSIYRDMGNGVASAGIEYYLPLFFEQTATLADYLPKRETVLVQHGAVDDALQTFWEETRQRHQFLSKDIERPILSPAEIYLSAELFFSLFNQAARVNLSGAKSAMVPEYCGVALPDLSAERRAENPLHKLKSFLEQKPGYQQIVMLAPSEGRKETLLQYLNEHGLKPATYATLQEAVNSGEAFCMATATLDTGFGILHKHDPRIALITESELFATAAPRRKNGRRQERQSNVESMIRDLSELKPGDPVVHQQHGIGRYQGLTTMDLGEGASEFLHLNYANGSNLFVPVSQLHVISRYSGADPDNAPLHALGSGQWEKARNKAAKMVRDTAAELLNLYARRALRKGHEFKLNANHYEAFVEKFGFEETADQAAAINAVIGDMLSPRPMDRLVCGDVGFGKTEVALRAAFVSVMDGKQVVLLSPTTLLAEQHFQTFSDRFSDWPVKVVELSRFKSPKEIREAIDLINSGKADIIIGTHKVLSSDIEFSRLGLVIIDEEHRFGVRQKEALKNLRAEVDVLALTATPIPRTLAMSMEGIRDFSVIATAPQRRLSIKTFVRRETDSVIREAILRELKRGGQVYYLHNEVDTIENRKEALEKILPEARIAIAHGQMPERDLERVMRDFYHQRFNVLLCTTIIETGIDVPTANTIVIHRADKFGLAQLHQLRGRVGRSHHQAYAYLMVNNEEGLTKNAGRRLEAITMMEDLGSGFYLAMHDLEIRGAGEVLGANQSGNVHEVGFQMYTDMLNHAVRSLKSGKEPDLTAPLNATVEINLHTPALLPESYCTDVHERLTLYKRLASTETMDDISDMQEALIDRFGKLPEETKALLETHRIRILAKPLGVQKIDSSTEATVVQFEPNANVDAAKIIQLIQKERDYKLAGPDKLRINKRIENLSDRVTMMKNLIKQLAGQPA
ncbi:transcription-repair coupling factor [Limnobacter litoralis]|uniref:transcription-repair coupling factor n=1 Tax=Limnobacter litoralis TaxID=481366 RepID=UPI0024E06467|nr:transcription-repair coupling factor [Limnobacter litoralis]